VRRLGFQPDVIHAHVYTAGVPAAVVGKLFGIPMVVTEHFTGFHEGSLGIGGIWKARIAFRRAARVLPVCDYLKRAIAAHGIRANFKIVPNAVDTSLFFMNGAHHDRPRRLIFVGSLEPTQQKGFPTLVEALGRLREHRADWHLDVVGQGPSFADSERLVTSADLSALVTFHGAVAKPRLAEMMRSSDLFVLPSRFENLPCAIIEAMASGLPVVSTTVGGIPEMVSEGDGILVQRDDAPALAEALARGLSDLSSFDRAGISSRAQARFSLASVGGELSAIYDTVVSR
jgi:glycosyltransferase involved in cell wall biosynthesis